jgi:nucleoside 2-deoxyribosyltransferase
MRKTFLICPVRGHSQNETKEIVKKLEADGWAVHWPPRDTDQTDPVGLAICEQNRQAILESDMVHIIWNGESQGCLFDMGMAFMLKKPITILSIPESADNGKSFYKMLLAWEKQY